MNRRKPKIRIGIIDMNAGVPNQGMRCICEIVDQWAEANNLDLSYDVFDIRQKHEVPDLSYHAYISSGGPGSPLSSKGTIWENKYFDFIRKVEEWNEGTDNYPKKHIFFICHSFQLACRYYNFARVKKRKSTAFGIFPMHRVNGKDEVVFKGLQDPFYAVDSRNFQVTRPDEELLKKNGGSILAIEKERPHVPLERAVMAVRFNEYFIGTQFHPEADVVGMTMYLQREDKRKTVVENYGEEKWENMIEQLNDPDKINWTYSHILPNFLNNALADFGNGKREYLFK